MPLPPVDAAAVAANVAAVRERIAAAGGAGRTRLVAVTKGFGPDAVSAACSAGVLDIGENYAQELESKADDPPAGVRWHFIGRVQRNKVRRLAPLVHLWHTVDRVELGRTIAEHAPGAPVLVQLNVSGSTAQGGCEPRSAPALVESLRGLGLDVRGVMAIGAQGSTDAARRSFRLVRELADSLGLPERSMGMSGDLEAAVEEGATIVRVGSALFGPGP